MFILLTIISAMLFVTGIFLAIIGYMKLTVQHKYFIPFVVGCILAVIGVISLLICSIALNFCANEVDTAHAIDEKIVMYEEVNAALEENILRTFNNYLDYEKDVFTSLTPETVTIAIELCPELQSDTVVMSQINTYFDNIEKVRELSEERRTAAKAQWWINFRNQS